jgi:hypothetical protein
MRHDSQSGITWQLLPFGLLVVLATGAGRVESGPSSAVTDRAVTDRRCVHGCSVRSCIYVFVPTRLGRREL